MFIVKHIPSGKYFKRADSHVSIFDNWKKVDKNEATIFRTKSGILNCLGKNIPNPKRESNRYARPFFHKKLDSKFWQIIPIKLVEG